MKIETIAVHGGYTPDPTTKAVAVPIYQTVAYAFDNTQHGADLFDLKVAGNIYSRIMNPTNAVLEARVAAMEGGIAALVVASGMSAIAYAIQTIAEAGDNIVSASTLYGGTYNLFAHTFPQMGIEVRFADYRDPASFAKLIDARTKAVYCETIGNPLGNITDLAALSAVAHAHGVPLIVDNTVASPYLCRPFEHGADIVVHSLTKYLGGHSDVIQGALVMNNQSLRDELYFIQKSCGAVPGPMDCFLVLRGIKTLGIRMERHSKNGAAIAKFLQAHPSIKKVYWPGFTDHPGHEIAKSQMSNFGGMISFELKDESMEAAIKVLSGTKLFSLAESLGGVESLINHPASMTHASIPREQRIANGLADGLIRLSVGIEDAEDIIADLAQAIG